MLGRSKIEVTEVGCELRKQSLDVLAGAVPCDDTVHGRGVAKIMQARRAQLADGTVDAGGSSHVLEHRDDARIAPSSNAARREERRCLPERRGQQAAAFEVRSQLVGKLRSDRNQTRLEEFRAADAVVSATRLRSPGTASRNRTISSPLKTSFRPNVTP